MDVDIGLRRESAVRGAPRSPSVSRRLRLAVGSGQGPCPLSALLTLSAWIRFSGPQRLQLEARPAVRPRVEGAVWRTAAGSVRRRDTACGPEEFHTAALDVFPGCCEDPA